MRAALAYTGPHGATFRPTVVALAENVDVPAEPSASRNVLQCPEPTPGPGITNAVVLVNKPVTTRYGLACLIESEFTAGGMRLRERNYALTVPNRLGNQALVRVMATALADDWPRLGSQLDAVMTGLTIAR